MSVLDEREALEVLGLPLNSNFDTVKSCYKKLALKNHPDKDSSSGANERFAKINKAFELLSRIHSSHQPIKRDGPRKRQPPPNIFNLMLTLEEIFNGVVKYEEVKRKLVDKYEFIVLEVEVVPGTLTGTNIVLPNKGDILSEDGIAANVIFVVKELEHDKFIRDRFNLIYNFKINVLDTLRVDQSLNIPTIDGDTIQLEMDQLIVSTTEKQIPNRGLPYPKAPNGKRGSLIVKFDIKYDKQDPPIRYKFCVSLEQLYSGCEKRFRINRLTLDNEEEYVEFKIEIKPGTRGGTEFKFPRAGDRKLNVIPSDIIFYIEEKPHPKFRRIDKNDDLMVTEYFAPLELGQRIKIPSLSNNDLEIIVDDDLISQMETVRLFEGEGMPNYGDPKIRGSLKVKMILLENDSIDRSKTVDLELSLETIMNGGTVLKVVKQKIFDDDGNEFIIDSFHKFQIVSGILDGTKFTIYRGGNHYPRRVPGNLIFVTRSIKHTMFYRENMNLIHVIPLTKKRISIDGVVEIPTLNDEPNLNLSLSNIVDYRQCVKFKNYGFPNPNQIDIRGNLIVRFKMEYELKQSDPIEYDLKLNHHLMENGCKKKFNINRRIYNFDGSFRSEDKIIVINIPPKTKDGKRIIVFDCGDHYYNENPQDLIFITRATFD